MNLDAYRVTGGQVELGERSTREHAGLERKDAEQRTALLQGRLAELQEQLYAEGKQSLLVVLQARDAGGKDGTVKHVFSGLNPQGVSVVSFKVPSAEEAAHDFLWRVHAKAPAAGYIAVFNRSHYEDVLVTRVHQLIKQDEAERRYQHIRAFESLLLDRGTRILKFYLHVSKEEQQERLQARIDTPQKRWKFNPGDLQERALWEQYTHAYEAAFCATATPDAPWWVVPADRKWFRNLVISEIIVQTLESMNPLFPTATFDPRAVDLK